MMLIPDSRIEFWKYDPVDVAAIERRADGVVVPMPNRELSKYIVEESTTFVAE